MSAEQPVLTELIDGVLLVTLDRPEAMNALSIAMAQELTRTWHRAAQDDEVTAVVVTGAGRGFCAGADLREKRTGDVAREALGVTYHPHVRALVALEKPVVAAINGAVAGAGLSIALGADVRIAGENAKFVPAFGTIGLIPDSGVGYLAARILGDAAALQWLVSGRRLSAAQALESRLVEFVVADPVAEALSTARALGEIPGRAYGLTKRIMWMEGRRRLAEYLDAEVDIQQLALEDPARQRARDSVASGMGASDHKQGAAE
ncbi:hypothetical protein ASD65_09940 [Microbacterium sp. Root61]|uniref:enoyl-CoA hydratase/isomerase family protein n=1 Tax=Microbacterium sp. Root61 TaxID=1736570 RepID=UPI0006F6FA53|nr:enoyl-CoA hydratase/isomerase family protein [Microbacterium sp. Root61]KRA24701.1 hypothetical protein ASD65_09940 [Microbacterium sp. Root61]